MSTAQPPFLSFDVEPDEAGLPINRILRRRFGVSRTLLRRLRLYGTVLADGRKVRLGDTAEAGQRVALVLPPEHGVMPEPLPLDVRFEDKHIIVVNKPPGMLVHPVGWEQTGTLANAVASHVRQQGGENLSGPVTRLDRDTSGLVLFAKHPHAHYRLSEDLAAGRLTRTYTAIAVGWLKSDEGTIDAPIRRVPGSTVLREVAADGQRAVTHYRVLRRYSGPDPLTQATCAALTLETGRTHQIRVHLAHIGHPVVGDSLYGDDVPGLMDRQALHASELRLLHPIDRCEVHIASDLPADMQRLLNVMRAV